MNIVVPNKWMFDCVKDSKIMSNFDWFEGESIINVNRLDVYGNCEVNNEYWFGSVSSIIIYDSKRDYWKVKKKFKLI